jgi:hypothetical protein
MDKYFKNPARGKKQSMPLYVPQWQQLGKEPVKVDFGSPQGSPQLTKHAPFIAHTTSARVARTPGIGANVPFAEVAPSPVRHNASMPNVGNNIENTWAALDEAVINEDGELVEGALDPNHPMIDNNFDDPNNYQHIPPHVRTAPVSQDEYIVVEDSSQLNIEYNEYVLVFDGEIISTGALDPIQEEIRALIFGEHPLAQNRSIAPEDVIVLKRIKIKVGVFIE